MSNIIVIPARGGSKGIPLKNIYPINGIPLLEYTLKSLEEIESKLEFDVVVSTDSDKISNVALNYDKVIVVRRPEKISLDTSSTEEALLHTLKFMNEKYNKIYDNIITLQPTSPLRKASTIKKFIDEFIDNSLEFDAQLTLTESYSDYWINSNGNSFERLFKNHPRRRQEREPLYIENSAIYITKVSALLETGSVLGNNVRGFVIDAIEGIDINEMIDINIAENFLKLEG